MDLPVVLNGQRSFIERLTHPFLLQNIYRYGPPVRFWCMRFEGKHNYFKDLAHRIKCFKNIPKTMAIRHQNLMCYHFGATSSRSPLFKDTIFGPGMHA